MSVTSGLLMTLFAQNQPYDQALKVPCDVILEIVEAKLDEGLSYLEGDNAARARDEIAICKEFGSIEAFVAEAMAENRPKPDILTA